MKDQSKLPSAAAFASILALAGLLVFWTRDAVAQAHPPGSLGEAESPVLPAPQAETNPPVTVGPAPGTDAWLSPDLEPSLRELREKLVSPHFLPSPRLAEEEAALAELRQQLELARRQRREKQFQQAEELLISVLESAPRDLQRSALLELGLLAQDSRQPARAQQIYSQYVQRFSDDPTVPEVLLRQGLLYREMGAPVMALSKFYGVLSSALHLKPEWLEYYQRLVLQAQTEIAETYFLQGKFEEATDFFSRVLKLDHPELNRAEALSKLVRSYAALDRHLETVAQAQLFTKLHSDSEHLSEVRFLLADALLQLRRHRDAKQQVLLLLQSEHAAARRNPENWRYWQHRAGNKIANELYRAGDHLNALEIYLTLAEINSSPGWQLPVWYQAALIFERLEQPEKARDLYARILDRRSELANRTPAPALAVVLDMAQWRKNHLNWQAQAEEATRELTTRSQ